MKLITLTRGQFAIVDDADFDWLNQWKWYAMEKGGLWYARRWDGIKNGKRVFILMHRLILGLIDRKIHCDHKDGNGLNNQRDNIRGCTVSQNCMNRKVNSAKFSSKFVGVYFMTKKKTNKWRALIHKEGKRTHLGYFQSENDAAMAYNKAAISLFGIFSKANII